VKVSVLQCIMILNKLTYKLDHKRELYCNERENKVTLTTIVQMAVEKKNICSANSFKNFHFHYIGTVYLI